MNNSFLRASIGRVVSVSCLVALTSIPANEAQASEQTPSILGSLMDKVEFSRAMQLARDSLRSFNSMSKLQLKLEPQALVKNEGVSSFRFQQSLGGVPVLGGITVVESGRNGDEGVVFETPRFAVNTKPTLAAADALRIAGAETRLNLATGTSELKVLPNEDQSGARLVYWVDYPTSIDGEGGDLIIDAHSGDVLARLTKFTTVAPIDVWTAAKSGKTFKVNGHMGPDHKPVFESCEIGDLATGATKTISIPECDEFMQTEVPSKICQMVEAGSGDPLMVNIKACTQEIKNLQAVSGTPSESATRAAENSRKVLEYYATVHQRNSFDDQGGTAKSVVQIGVGHANASWNSELGLMSYGGGDGKLFGDFTTSLDVAGHEMTHGVTSRTAKFINRGESGALDEGYADFFGLMITNNGSWIMGSNLFLDHSRKGLRDIADPSSLNHYFMGEDGKPVRKPMPKHVREKFDSFGKTCDDKNDRCYVHGNSTILSHALYQMHESIGREKTQKIAYQGLTRYLSASSNFAAAKEASVKACAGLYDEATCERVKAAFGVVGL